MKTREYFEKVMQNYNQNRKGRSLRKYCKDEAVVMTGSLSLRNHIVQISFNQMKTRSWAKVSCKRPKTDLVI